MNQEKLITLANEAIIYQHMSEELYALDCHTKIINGHLDHVHCLFMFNPKKAITDVVKQLKGNSSHWINQNDIVVSKFVWQAGFSVFSVSESQLEKVFQYIAKQKELHKKQTFAYEYTALRKVHNIPFPTDTEI